LILTRIWCLLCALAHTDCGAVRHLCCIPKGNAALAGIVPVAIDGFERAWGRGRGIRLFQTLQIRVGEPIEPPPATNASEKTYDALTQELRQKVMDMWLDLHGERQVKPELVDTRS
jgi:1-acyl-sn-glycerol-3-phosphate acyltransferase